MSGRWVHYFSDAPPEGCTDLKELLGGKGASLNELSRAGLNVPPGFTISPACCAYYLAHDRDWPAGLEAEVQENLARLELQIVIDTLFRRIPELRPAVPVEQLSFKDDATVYGVREFPVTW